LYIPLLDRNGRKRVVMVAFGAWWLIFGGRKNFWLEVEVRLGKVT
jgi:hypothetical protein